MSRAGAAPILLGIVLGIAGGLVYGWVLQPVRFTETAPSALRSDFQEEYVALIAAAYAATGDLPRAQARLALLPGAASTDYLAALAQARLAAGRPEAEVRALAALAAAVAGVSASPSPAPTATLPDRGTPAAATPAPTPRPLPSPQATFTPGAPFRLTEKALICDDPADKPRLQVVVLNAAGEGVPNVKVRVLWDAGEDQFYTGLKPEMGLGFGDFTLDPLLEYTVQLAESDAVASAIRSEPCPGPGGQPHPGSWRLTFVQPAAP